MGHGAASKMLNEDLHWRLVCEGAVLLIESKMVWVQMDDQRRRASTKLLQDIAVRLD
jgi:hypothetical protein